MPLEQLRVPRSDYWAGLGDAWGALPGDGLGRIRDAFDIQER